VDELKAGRPETPPRPNYFDPEDLVTYSRHFIFFVNNKSAQ
jgi:hypothetical protein